jgi:hypothetical protein
MPHMNSLSPRFGTTLSRPSDFKVGNGPERQCKEVATARENWAALSGSITYAEIERRDSQQRWNREDCALRESLILKNKVCLGADYLTAVRHSSVLVPHRVYPASGSQAPGVDSTNSRR